MCRHEATALAARSTVASKVLPSSRSSTTTAARRPNLVGGGLQEVIDLMAAREPLYRAVASAAFDAAGASPEAVAAAILAAWHRTAPATPGDRPGPAAP